MKLGAIPKVVMSAIESSCFPNLLFILQYLATNPSRKSNNAPVKMQSEAILKLPWKAKIIEKIPQQRFVRVIKLGIFFVRVFTVNKNMIIFVIKYE